MTKYIIELEDDIKYLIINGRADNRCYTLVRPVAELEILNSDYINEHFSDLQDAVYQEGFEDGKNSIDKGCGGCKFESRTAMEEPCKYCYNCHTSKYTPMPKEDDRIEVGDWVYDESDTPNSWAVVTWADGDDACIMCKDGSTAEKKTHELRKTGRHFDIASILEAMRT